MAIAWLRLIRSVPWDKVAKKAPEIAYLAKRLWNTTYNISPSEETDSLNSQGLGSQALTGLPSLYSENERIISLEEKLAVIEANSSRQHHQLKEAVELITGLAEQNAQLIKTTEINRVWIMRLAAYSVFTSILAASSLFLVLR